jgi:uncharacterized protein
MINGRPLVDVHLHVARLPTLKEARRDWAEDFADAGVMSRAHDAAGTPVPARFDEHLAPIACQVCNRTLAVLAR